MNSYSRTEIKDGKYITTQIVETIISEKEIVGVDDRIFKVLATGAYGQIKVSDGYREFTLMNPFSNYWGKDARTTKQIVALNPTFDKVLDMTNATFDLAPEVMAKLHRELYIGSDAYWVELNEENLKLCI